MRICFSFSLFSWKYLVLKFWGSVCLQALNAIPDQSLFYDVSDSLEEQGFESIINYHVNRKDAAPQLVDQFSIYEAVLQSEDGISSQMLNQVDNIRSVGICLKQKRF